MLFSSSKEALRRALVGISAEIQGTDTDEISFDTGASSQCFVTSARSHIRPRSFLIVFEKVSRTR